MEGVERQNNVNTKLTEEQLRALERVSRALFERGRIEALESERAFLERIARVSAIEPQVREETEVE